MSASLAGAGPGADTPVEGRRGGVRTARLGSAGRTCRPGQGKPLWARPRLSEGWGSSWGSSWLRSGLRSVSASPWGPRAGGGLAWLVGCGVERPASQCQVVLSSQPPCGNPWDPEGRVGQGPRRGPDFSGEGVAGGGGSV